jgi:RNA polymerase sigma factor (sigma-70 family)
VAEVGRWIARVLAAPSFWSLRREWSDLHQEAMGRLIESLRRGRFDASKDFQAYVQGVARFTGYKAVARHVQHAGDADLDPEAAAEVSEDRGSEERLLAIQLARQALAVASKDCRVLVTAYFLEDRSYGEIAESWGLALGTVKSRLFRCMGAIQQALRGPVAS